MTLFTWVIGLLPGGKLIPLGHSHCGKYSPLLLLEYLFLGTNLTFLTQYFSLAQKGK